MNFISITVMAIVLALSGLAIAQPKSSKPEAETLAFLKKHDAEIHAFLLDLRQNDRADYRSALADAKIAAREHRNLIEFDAAGAAAYLEMYRIDFEAIGVADQIVLTDDEDRRQELRGELRKLIALSFDQWVIFERAKLRKLAADVESMQQSLAADIKNKSAVVDHDIDALIAESRKYQKEKSR